MLLMMVATSLWGIGGDAMRILIGDAGISRIVAVSASLLMVASVSVALVI